MPKKTKSIRSLYHAWLGIKHFLSSWHSPFLRLAPAGHYLSPIPSLNEIKSRSASLFDQSVEELPGINLNQENQLNLLEAFTPYEKDFPYIQESKSGLRYKPANTYFPIADALVLYSFLRHYTPQKVIEIGSGFSSAVSLDTNEHFLGGSSTFTFIEPYPTRLNTLLKATDRQSVEIIEKQVQDVPLPTFEALKANDILFVDSSHILKIGSDVAYIIFEILPVLAPGVLVHFHDIFWPFEYPQAWYEQGYCCNEDQALRSFLQFNDRFSITFFTSYLQVHQQAALSKHLPMLSGNPGCSLWLVKDA